MESKTVLVLLALVFVFKTGSALKCYVCAGTNSSECANGKRTSMAVESCIIPHSMNSTSWQTAFHDDHSSDENDRRFKTVCLKLTMSGFEPNLLVRGCGYAPLHVDPCTFVKRMHNIKQCKSCITNLCNLNIDTEDNSDI